MLILASAVDYDNLEEKKGARRSEKGCDGADVRECRIVSDTRLTFSFPIKRLVCNLPSAEPVERLCSMFKC